jgi:hypothetical protein
MTVVCMNLDPLEPIFAPNAIALGYEVIYERIPWIGGSVG